MSSWITSSGVSTSSSSPPLWAAEGGSDCREFEAAVVLASLRTRNPAAEAAESNGGEGKRSSQRVNNELDPSHSSGSGLNSVPLPFDLNVSPDEIYQRPENGCQSVDIKVEELCESAEPGRIGNVPHNERNSGHKLTEAEKETRRIRRILANRESARQTIRRRRALFEELARKAINLASENENLIKSKELAMKEYQSQQSSNQNLKEQIYQALRLKVGENRGEAKLQPVYIRNNLSATPYILPSYNHPSEIVAAHINPCLLHDQENNPNINGQNMPCYISPCSCSLALHNFGHQLPSSNLQHKYNEAGFKDNTRISSPSSIIHILDNSLEAHITTQEGCISPNPLPRSEPSFETGVHVSGECVVNLGKNKGVGAEARKRRKELLKLKSLHCTPSKGGYR